MIFKSELYFSATNSCLFDRIYYLCSTTESAETIALGSVL